MRGAYMVSSQQQRREGPLERYKVRVIDDPAAESIKSLGDVLATFDDAAEAKRYANKQSSRIYGTAIVDTVDKKIDWGCAITDYRGEPLWQVGEV